MRAQEPEGTTTGAASPNTRKQWRATLRAAGQSPLLNAGWLQQVWSSEKLTSHPRCSSTSTVARATSSKNASARQVAISWTRGAFIFGTLTNPDLRIHAHWAPLASFA
jgi:hypothetical protein